MFDNRDNIDFGAADIPKLFRALFVPTLLGMTFNVAFTITDGIFVGNGVGPQGLASVNLVAPIMMIMTGLGMMFGIGSSVVAAIHLSHDNTKAARINVTQAYLTCVILASLLGICFYLFPSTILHLLGVSNELMAMAKEYYLWFVPTCLFLMFQIVNMANRALLYLVIAVLSQCQMLTNLQTLLLIQVNYLYQQIKLY